ncbi:MAG TPA: hypothetical protein EYQ58_06535 [Candidatus Poseidoniales archaeon]|nr:hypothetical protein [Candidatus Poseidoniales archaeon]
MGEDVSNNSEKQIHLNSLPDEVQRLADTMAGIEPDWDIKQWMIDQANMTLDIISMDLNRERLTIEQRLHRVNSIAQRLEPLSDGEIDPDQRNLFDCFDLNDAHGIRGLGQRAAEPNEQLPVELDDATHPANAFLNFLPDDHGDDPLLAIACQLMLFVVESVMAKGEPVATLDSIYDGMTEHGVNVEETEEALEHLLTTGGLVEVDDDCFIPLV